MFPCAAKLIDHFRAVKRKPTVHLGQIVDAGCEANKQGLVKLAKAGFRLSVWKELQKLLQSQENAESQELMEGIIEESNHLRSTQTTC